MQEDSLIAMIHGNSDKVDAALRMLGKFQIVETVRTGMQGHNTFSRATFYRDPQLRAIVDGHRTRHEQLRTITKHSQNANEVAQP